MAERAAIVTGASSGIGLAHRGDAGRGGLRPDRGRAAPRQARGGRRGPARQGLRGRGGRRQPRRRGRSCRQVVARPPRALRAPRRARQQRRRRRRRARRRDRRRSSSTSSSTSTCARSSSSTASASTCCARPAPSTATRSSSTRRRSPASAARRGCRSTRPRRTAVVGFTQAMNKELDGEGIKSTRAVPRLRRHADDRLRQGAGPGRGHDPGRRTSPRRCAAADALPRLRHPRDPVRAARASAELERAARLASRSPASVRSRRVASPAAASRAGACVAPARRGRAPGARRSRPPRSALAALGEDRRLEVGVEDAQLALGRAPRARLARGEAVPRPGEGDEARAPAAAVGGEHRADAAVRGRSRRRR